MIKLFEQRFPYGDKNRKSDPHYYLRVLEGKVKIGKHRCPMLVLDHYCYKLPDEAERQMKTGIEPVWALAWDTINKALPNRWAISFNELIHRFGEGDTWTARVRLYEEDEVSWMLFFQPQGSTSFARLMFLRYTPLADFDPQGIEATLESWRQEVIDSDAQGWSSLMDNPSGKFTRAEWAAIQGSLPKAYAS